MRGFVTGLLVGAVAVAAFTMVDFDGIERIGKNGAGSISITREPTRVTVPEFNVKLTEKTFNLPRLHFGPAAQPEARRETTTYNYN